MMNKSMVRLVMALVLVVASSSMTASAASRKAECALYAATATEQYRASKYAQCNHSGLRWSDDAEGQMKWCMTVRASITQAETAARAKLMTACYAGKADVDNKKEPIKVPNACSANRENYKPVRYIFTRTYYNSPPESITAIPKGLITYDFNKDRKNDYVFLERNPNLKLRTIMCMSSSSGWKRQSLWPVTTDVSSHFGLESNSYGFENGKLSYNYVYNEHNMGSRSSRSTYSYSVQEKSFLLDTISSEFYSGDGMTENTEDVSDYVNGTITTTVDCGSLETYGIPCTPQNKQVTKMKKENYTVAARRLKK